ncbi:MAG: 3-oxoacyl-[acyl-carrier-protein] reductase [Candidatus Desulfovibrio kirbyi]|uniref:3-oxoacyl-[acyl-carrier-protein] reductase n=1 Tax=Candidatus Desulfovibrio kirbyi TaxID=2696086 RepID=A0A6L2R5A5_9BACT|nr:MAG: 3-oxoacyl-[acyl-carrier-protein] reductase [Candidatus Desulfovibrio kirbyi]
MDSARATLSTGFLPATAVVTGGSRGIGRAIASRLARDGYQIFLTYVSRPDEARATVDGILAAGGQAKAFALNVSDSSAVTDFFAAEIKDRVDLAVLVNNAGITKDSFLVRMKDEDFDKVLSVNLRGAFVCTREAAKIMSRARAGRIVNITSVAGQMGNAGQANYASAKAALLGLTKSCAKELASRNITVNAVSPGFIETDMTAELSAEIRESYTATVPLKRMGTPREVAEAVAFLASDKASYITGQILAVNGGMYC